MTSQKGPKLAMSIRKSLCIFDFDGTLVDSMTSFADLAASLISQHFDLNPAQARQAYLDTSGLPFYQQLEILFPKHVKNHEVSELFESNKRKDYLEKPLFKDVESGLTRLRKNKIRVAISSNNSHELVEQYLAKKNNFPSDLVLGYRKDFAKGRQHFDHILNFFDVAPSEALFVGDSQQDGKKALDYGLDFVGRVGTVSDQEFQTLSPQIKTVNNLHELAEWLCK